MDARRQTDYSSLYVLHALVRTVLPTDYHPYLATLLIINTYVLLHEVYSVYDRKLDHHGYIHTKLTRIGKPADG
jgi:hypothetical protein